MRFPKRSAMALQFACVLYATSHLACCVGCTGGANSTHSVHGIVQFSDGKVLREGTVEFELVSRDESVTATGEIQADGSFTLGTFAADDGAIAGKHRVVVISDFEIGNGAERPGMIVKSKLHQKYREFRTSGLTFTVKPGKNQFVIQVDYAPQTGANENNGG